MYRVVIKEKNLKKETKKYCKTVTMDKHLYKSLKKITSLAAYYEDENTFCPQNFIFTNKLNFLPIVNSQLDEDPHKTFWEIEAGAEKHTELVPSSSAIQYIFDSGLCIWSKRIEKDIEMVTSSSKMQQQTRKDFNIKLFTWSSSDKEHSEDQSLIIQQDQDIFDSQLYIWSRGVEKPTIEKDVAMRTLVFEFANNSSNTFLSICIEWKGCRTSSREATPLGDPRGVPKFTDCHFQVFSSNFLDCSKVGQLSEYSTVLAIFDSKVGAKIGFPPTVKSYNISARPPLNRSGFELSRLKEARSSLLQGWRFGKKLSAYLSAIKQFLSEWIVLIICSMMWFLQTKKIL